MNYPIYRKYQNGIEFHKVFSETEFISVAQYKLNGKLQYRLILSHNSMMLADILGDDLAMPASRDEFEKAYGEAFFHFQKANTIV